MGRPDSRARYYRPELDVVRLIAFVSVFLTHALPYGSDARIAGLLGRFAPVFYGYVQASAFGLSLFFTLSAFLICELLLRERQASGTLDIKRFYIRRILRIWPLYYLALLLGLVFAHIFGGLHAESAQFRSLALFTAAWYITAHGWMDWPILPLWSISVEEQFYLVVPWFIRYLNRRALYGFCFLLAASANGWLFVLGRKRVEEYSVWANTFVQFECFAAGILLCLFLRGKTPQLSRWQRAGLLVCWQLCWFAAAYELHVKFGAHANPGSWALMSGYALISFGSVFVLAAFLGMDPQSLPRWAVFLGRISFGLYVFQDFAMMVSHRLINENIHSTAGLNYAMKVGLAGVLQVAVPLGLTILAATLSYFYFETPFLRLKRHFAAIDSQPPAAAGLGQETSQKIRESSSRAME